MNTQSHDQSPLKVLVIDDDPDHAGEVADSLRDDSCNVVVAATASEGILLASMESPDVVVLDLGLPDGHGFDVARTIRAEHLHAEAAIVVLTGIRVHDLAPSDNVDVDLILHKPVQSDLLAGLLRHVRAHRVARHVQR